MLDSLVKIDRTITRLEKWLPPPKSSKRNKVAIPCLAEFVKQSWHVLEPGAELTWNWHIDAMCLHAEVLLIGWMRSQPGINWRSPLETLLTWLRQGTAELQACVEGLEAWRDREDAQQPYQNLLINVPPGSLKSRTISVCLPAWMWLHVPRWRSLFLSANPRVAMRDALFCRDLVESKWYRDTFQPAWGLRADQSAKSNYWNTAGGMRFAFGMTAKITGDRADALFIDDPHDAEEVKNSEARRLEVLERWDNAIRNRVNDLRYSVRLGIMQRLHTEDWSGHVLSKGGWEHLSIEQEFDAEVERRGLSSLGWDDPRSQPGELMFPIRFPAEVLTEEKEVLGSFGYAGQHQQRPVPLEGGLIKAKDIGRYNTPRSRYDQIVISLDSAKKKGTSNCPWSWGVFGVTRDSYDLLSVHTERHDYPSGKRTMLNLILQWNPDAVLIEDKSSGTILLQELKDPKDAGKAAAGLGGRRINAIAILPEADKITRMATQTPTIEAGWLRLPENAPWLPDFEAVLFSYPRSSISDPIDMLSQFLKWAKARSVSVAQPQHRAMQANSNMRVF